MKKFLIGLSVLAFVFSVNSAIAEEVVIQQTKTEQVMENISIKAQDVAEDTADAVKSGAKKQADLSRKSLL